MPRYPLARRLALAALAASLVWGSVALAAITNPQGRTFDATAGQEFSGVVATFHEDGKIESTEFATAEIYWGDGTAKSPGTIEFSGPPGNQDFTVSGKHTYGFGGTCTVTTTLKRDGGQVVHIESKANVSGPPGGQCASAPKPPPDPPQTGIELPDSTRREGYTSILIPKSTPGSSNIVKAHWDFGDGKTLDVDQGNPPGPNGPVDHIWDDPGDYHVTLTVTDENGLTATAGADVKVVGAPKAVIAIKPEEGKEDTKFALDATKSAVPGGKIVRYQWTCDGGEKDTSYDSEKIGLKKAAKVTCVFGKGLASVALIVTSDQGETSLATRSVAVKKKRPPHAWLEAAPYSPEQGQAVTFDASKSGSHSKGDGSDGTPPDGIQDYHWEWGDGTEEHTTGPIAQHAFNGDEGPRKVKVTVTDVEGQASTTATINLQTKCLNEIDVLGLKLRGDCIKATQCLNGKKGCFEVPKGGALSLNGVTLKPPSSGGIVHVDPAKGLITRNVKDAANLAFTLGPWTLPSFPELKVPKGDVKVLSDAFRLDGVSLHGLKVSSDPLVFRTNGTIGLPVNVKLPPPLSFVSGRAEIGGSLDGGVSLNAIHVEANDIPLPPFHVERASFDYDGAANSWSGSLALATPSGTFGGDIRFLNGSLNHLGLFGENLNLPVGYGVFLQRIAGSYTVSPRQISAGVGISAGPELSIPGAGSGSLFGMTADFTLSYPDAGGWLVALNGEGSVVGVPVGTFGASLDSNGRFAANVHFNTTLYTVFDVNAFLDFVYYDPSLFQASAKIDICTKYIVHECAGGDLVLSSVGIAACIRLPWFLPDIGGYYRWGEGSANFYFSGCSVGPVQIQVARLTAAQAPRSFTVAKGTQSEVLAFEGQDGPPNVTLTGPGGQRMETPADGYDMTEPFFVSQEPKDKKTYVMISRPNAGRWTVAVAEGSTPVVKMERAQGLPDPKVKARVTGSGAKRRLSWEATPIQGQRITFSEQGGKAGKRIVATTKARGSIAFTPADGPKEKRTIVAEVLQGGNPRATLRVAGYTAPRVAPGRVPGLKLRRKGSGLQVSWGRAPGATGYAVNVSVSDGRLIPLLTAKRTVTIPGFAKTERATVTVAGYRVAGLNGPAAKATLRPPKAKRKG